MKMSKRQRIDASREVRLWISTIITPVIGGLTFALTTHPEIREGIKNKYYDIKHNVKQKWKLWKTERDSKKEM